MLPYFRLILKLTIAYIILTKPKLLNYINFIHVLNKFYLYAFNNPYLYYLYCVVYNKYFVYISL